MGNFPWIPRLVLCNILCDSLLIREAKRNMTKKQQPRGADCKCEALHEGECACKANWIDPRISKLEAEISTLKQIIELIADRSKNKGCPSPHSYTICKTQHTFDKCKKCWIDYFYAKAEKEAE